MKIEIESKTRQWLAVVIIGGVIAGMIFTGLIPSSEYQKYIGFVVGAFFYHIVRMLNDSKAQSENPTQAVPKED